MIMATRLIPVLFTENGAVKTGLSPTITILRFSDNSVVVNAAAMTESGGGWYKYSFTSYDPAEDYGASFDAGVSTVDARIQYAVSAVADMRAIREKTDNLPSDPADQSAVEAAITSAQGSIVGEINANEAKIDILDTNVDTIVTKLPTNNIIGSSVKTDKDDEIDAIKLKTDKLTFDVSNNIESRVNDKGFLNDLSTSQVNGEVDAALSDIGLDHLVQVSIGTGKPTIGTLVDKIMNKNASQTFDPTADSLEAQADAVPDVPTESEIADAVETKLATEHGSGDWDAVTSVAGLATEANATTNKNDVIAAMPSVAGLATEANATSNKNSIISARPSVAGLATEVNATANKEDIIDAISSAEPDLSPVTTMLNRVLGLLHENTYVVNAFSGNVHTGSVIEIYDSKAHANTHDGSTGLVARYTLAVTMSGANPTSYKMVKE
jgi:hypothetical protein